LSAVSNLTFALAPISNPWWSPRDNDHQFPNAALAFQNCVQHGSKWCGVFCEDDGTEWQTRP